MEEGCGTDHAIHAAALSGHGVPGSFALKRSPWRSPDRTEPAVTNSNLDTKLYWDRRTPIPGGGRDTKRLILAAVAR